MATYQFHTGGRQLGIKYIGKEHVLHLLQVLKQDYETKEDWEGTRYLGTTIDWDYKK